MYRNKRLGLILLCGLITAPFLLSFLVLYYAENIGNTIFSFTQVLQEIRYAEYDSTFFFSLMLLGMLLLAYLKRRKRIRVAVGVLLGLIGHFCWFSTALWTEQNIDMAEQRVIAILLWAIAMIILITKSARKQKRKIFSQAVKREVIHKQNGKCAICKRKLQSYGLDFHHKNRDRSNNKASNCQVLCTVCHRKKHSL
jgi:peptidoglycan/LPS O-acetylase OafA/YrhL